MCVKVSKPYLPVWKPSVRWSVDIKMSDNMSQCVITYIHFHLRRRMADRRLYGVVSYAPEATDSEIMAYLQGVMPRRLQRQRHSVYYRRLRKWLDTEQTSHANMMTHFSSSASSRSRRHKSPERAHYSAISLTSRYLQETSDVLGIHQLDPLI